MKVEMVLMPISTTGSKRKRSSAAGKGFTMLELLVVLVILVMMSGIAMISIGPGIRDAKMRTGYRLIVSALSYARSNSVTKGITTRVVFSAKNAVYVEEAIDDDYKMLSTSSGRIRSMPDGIKVASVVKNNGSDDRWVEFDSLGQSSSSVIKVVNDYGTEGYVTVDGLTGLCKVKTEEEND